MINRRRFLTVAGISSLSGCLRQANDAAGAETDDGTAPNTPIPDDRTPTGSETETATETVSQPPPDELRDVGLDVVWDQAHSYEGRAPTGRDIHPDWYGTQFDEDGLYTIGGDDGLLYRYDPDSGSVLWESRLGTGLDDGDSFHLSESGDVLTVVTYDGTLRAIETIDGSTRWRESIEATETAAVVSDDESITVVWGGSSTGELAGIRRIDSQSGDLLWELNREELEAMTESSILLSAAGPLVGNDLYVATMNFGFILDVEAAELVEEVASSRFRGTRAGSRLIVSNGSSIRSYATADWDEAWSFSPLSRSNTTISVRDDLAVFGGTDHAVYALDAKTGEQRWRYQTDGRISKTPVVSNSRVWTVRPREPSQLISIDSRTGEPHGVHKLGSRIRTIGAVGGSVLALTADQTIRIDA